MMKYSVRSIVLAILVVLLAGCLGDQIAHQVGAKNDANIKRVSNLYYAYQRSHGWQGPKDEKALRDFVVEHGLPTENLQMMGIDEKNLDGLFKSERDGKPFKIRYGVPGGFGTTDALVFEDQGIDGKKEVAFTGSIVEDVDDARYKELWEHGGQPQGAASQSVGRPVPSANK